MEFWNLYFNKISDFFFKSYLYPIGSWWAICIPMLKILTSALYLQNSTTYNYNSELQESYILRQQIIRIKIHYFLPRSDIN